MNFQWYPGHMTKAKRMMQENISLIDLVIELVDARVPVSSRNPDIDELGKGKARIILLNKSDLADPKANKAWMTYFQEKGFHVVEVNSRTGAGVKSIQAVVQEACKEKIERDRKRGILNRPVRAMVVGIPNVGKSTFINSFAGKACAKTGNKPGVTKGKQWIKLNKGLELLDTPGILWPKFEDQAIGMKLAFIGSINDELAMDFLAHVFKRYGKLIQERYGLDATKLEQLDETDEKARKTAHSLQMLTDIAINRRCFKKGEEPDLERAAGMVMDDFRSGKLGRITLEWPEEI